MPVVRLTLAYDGTGFRGWARQKGQRTVEGVLEDALARFLASAPQLSVAGRTDAGVHARGQVASFASDEALDLVRLHRSLNSLLAPEVVVLDARSAPDGFDARFSATARVYRYRIDVGVLPDPFDARFVWHRPAQLSLAAMRSAARHLVGEHDFSAFCRNASGGAGNVRRLERLSVSRRGDRVEVTARANAFAHQMVRSLVGTLAAVGEGTRNADEVPAVLSSGDRSRAAQIAPPHGLTLEQVVYGGERGGQKDKARRYSPRPLKEGQRVRAAPSQAGRG